MHCKNLTSNNAVSNNGIINISNALQLNETLQILNISYNNITDDGAIAISGFLKVNNTLKELNVSYNQISYVGVIKCLEFYKQTQYFNYKYSTYHIIIIIYLIIEQWLLMGQ